MKLKKGAIGIGLVLAIAATVLLVWLPVSVNLYIAYVYCLIGICMMILSTVFFDKRDVCGSFAQFLQAAWFLPVSLAVSAIVLIAQEFVRVPPLAHMVVQFLLYAFAVIKLIGVNAGKDYIRRQEERAAENTGRIAGWLNEVDAVSAKLADRSEEQRAMRRVREAIRYSDPMSTASVVDIDERIEAKIFGLQADVGCAQRLIADCEDLCAELKNRSSVLKSTKA